MENYVALEIIWKQGSSDPVEYMGKKLYTEAPDHHTALGTFRAFAEEMDIPVTLMVAVPLTEEPSPDKYLKVEMPVPV